MIALIDYGMGNLRSVQKALERSGAGEVAITQSVDVVRKAEKVVLPGVGAMAPAMEKLNGLGLVGVIRDVVNSGRPFLGICLGFQLLFDRGFEHGEIEGLGILPGTVERFPSGVKVPQMGWNQLSLRPCPLWDGLVNGCEVYFCHSYYARPAHPEIIAATTDYGITYCSAAAMGNIFGVQFHPEKSQTVGLRMLENFARL